MTTETVETKEQTIARLQQELKDEQQRKDLEALKARELKLQARRDAEKQRIADIMHSLFAAIKVVMPSYVIPENNRGWDIFGDHTNVTFDIRENSSDGMWSRTSTGTYYILIKHGSETKRFPQKSDGTHSYGKAAQAAVELHEFAVAAQTRENNNAKVRANSLTVVETLKKEYDIGKYTEIVKISGVSDKVVVNCGFALTIDQARKVLDVLKEINPNFNKY